MRFFALVALLLVQNPNEAIYWRDNPGVPAGLIVISTSICATGYSEVTGLEGVTLVGTLAANGDVGTGGGNNNITPTGDVSQPTFTGDALNSHQHGIGTYLPNAHSGSAVANHASHTHTYTQVPNHVHVQNMPSGFTGGSAYFATDTSVNGSTGSYLSTANPTSGVATGTTNGPDATLTHSVTQPSDHTMAGSSESVSAGTPSGTINTPTFTGDQFDNRSAFIKVIFCSKN